MTKNNGSEDRISVIPDAILHLILSFLDMKEVVHTSLLSRRWRYVWTSVPYLNFNHSKWGFVRMPKKKRYTGGLSGSIQGGKEGFMNFVDKVLFLRDNSIIIQFQLSGSFYCDADRLNAWMSILSRRSVQEVYLKIHPLRSVMFPSVIFMSSILAFELDLDLDLDSYSDPLPCSLTFPLKVSLPISMCSAPHLKILRLIEVKLPQGNPNCELVFNCLVLKILILKDCEHGHLRLLDISAPQLRILSLRNGDEHIGSCQLKIHAPNLTELKLNGALYKDYHVGNLSLLCSVNIDVSGENDSVYYDSNLLIKLLKSLTAATTLKLSDLRISQEILDQMSTLFCNLRSIRLRVRGNPSWKRTIINLLQNSPRMESLIWEGWLDHIFFKTMETDGCEEDLSLECQFPHLKAIEFRCFSGSESEVKFIGLILKKAVVLESLTVKLSDRQKLISLRKKLCRLPRASSTITIVILS